MNKELAKFCGICWHEVINTEGKGKCSCGETAYDCLFEDRVEEYNPDFTGKDFHLLHTAMGKKGQWARFHHWLAVQNGLLRTWENFANTIADFHMLPFPEQAKLIYEFVEEMES